MSAQATYPLSPLQQGMLFHALSSPHSGVDIEQLVLTLREPVDVERLRAAWERVVARHGILRTAFRCDGAEPMQDVREKVAVPFRVEDRSGFVSGENATYLAVWMQADRACGFTMDEAPLLRLHLFRLGEEHWQLVWTFHHALLDGRSFPILLEEVFAFYENSALPELPQPLPYADFIAWHREQDHSAGESFWREQLAGFTTPNLLVVDGLGGRTATRQQGDVETSLPPAVTAQLIARTEQSGVTLNTLVQGAWAILLSRYTGEQDIVFGATRAGRHSTVAGADEMVGLFINTLPVRTTVREDALLIPWLQTLRASWLAVRPYEHTPLALVQAWSDVAAGCPLFSTLVVFENYDLATHFRQRGGAWARREIRLHEQTSFPLCLAACAGDSLRLVAEYDRSVFDEATIHRLLGHLRTLLEAIAQNPQATIGDLPMLTAGERTQLLHGWNPAPATQPPASTLHELFSAQARRTPHAVALVQDEARITYSELDSRANAVAAHLLALGIASEDIVGLCMERTPELVVALLGILKCNAAYLPIDLAYPPERLAYMMEDARAPMLLTQRSLAARLPHNSARLVFIEDIDPADYAPAPGKSEQLCYVLYTSGSTGKPKGCCITHQNVARLFTATQHWFRFDERDVWTLFHSTAFDFSVWEMWGALLHGGTLVVVPFAVSRSPEQFHALLIRERVTVLNQTPSAFRQLIAADAAAENAEPLSLRTVVFGGEALEMQSLKPWFDRHGDARPQLVNMYGITETTVHVTCRPLTASDLKRGSVIGVPIPDLQVFILDGMLRPVPIGVPGEMYVGGAGLARGYHQRPELTAQRFIPHPFAVGERLYKTGDLARFLPGHDIEYLGRIDQQVKIRGFRIELGEIESVLLQHPGIREAAVLARGASAVGRRLVAWLVPHGEMPAAAELRDHLRAFVPDYMIPAAFVAVEGMPLTANGKLDQRALPEPSDPRPELAAAFVAPRNPAEEQLAIIWQRVLKLVHVGVHDNFFELGGDSILTILIVSQARQHGLQLTPKMLFDRPTIAELATAATPVAAVRLRELPACGEVPLTPIQQWFFAHDFADVQHWNQSFAFTLTRHFSESEIAAAFGRVTAAHGVFRLCYERTHAGWRQSFRATALGAPAASSWAGLQSNLSLTGPLLRYAYDDETRELLIAIHHLAVDGVSWRILLEDLHRALCGQPPVEPTTGFHTWASALAGAANSVMLREEGAYWRDIVATPAAPLAPDFAGGENTEASAETLVVSLSETETSELLQQLPARTRARVQDALLTALAHALGGAERLIEIEGHGREESVLMEYGNLPAAADLSRTVGWFTTIFPVRLRAEISPSATLASTHAHTSAIPRNGFGYSLLRASGVVDAIAPDVLFNYLGQFDQTVGGLDSIEFSSTPTGEWHSPVARRTHLLEINCLVLNGALEVRWNYSRNLHRAETISRFADVFLSTLRELIASRFPLSLLGSAAQAEIVKRLGSLDDIYPLSPMQRLFYTIEAARPGSGSDQWHCQLHGPLDVARFQKAWTGIQRRHSALRTAYLGDLGLEPLQAVLREAPIPWQVEDLTALAPAALAARFSDFLAADAALPFDLTRAPLTRLALFRVAENEHRFVWSHHHLEIDGWSWPLVFRELATLYAGGELAPVPPYREAIAWLARHPADEDFWRGQLRGFTVPTPLPLSCSGAEQEPEIECTGALDVRATARLQQLSRSLQVTTGSLVQAAWAILLFHHSGAADVVFGAAFSGRPAEMEGADRIIGHFVNNLPVRARVLPADSLANFARSLHRQLGQLSEHQSAALADVQRFSDLPWHERLFSTLLVFQNYVATDAAQLDDVGVSGLHAPVRTNYPLTLIANPGETILFTLVALPRTASGEEISGLLAQFTRLLTVMVQGGDATLSELLRTLPPPCARVVAAPAATAPLQSAGTQMEEMIGAIWREALGRDVSLTANFFDQGGHSLLMLQVHSRLSAQLSREIPVVKLFQYPTIRTLALYLSGETVAPALANSVQDRAAKARAALMRRPPKARLR